MELHVFEAGHISESYLCGKPNLEPTIGVIALTSVISVPQPIHILGAIILVALHRGCDQLSIHEWSFRIGSLSANEATRPVAQWVENPEAPASLCFAALVADAVVGAIKLAQTVTTAVTIDTRTFFIFMIHSISLNLFDYDGQVLDDG